MITNFDDFCTWAFVVIDDLYQAVKPALKHSGPPAACTDSELITLAIVGECKGWNCETELISEWHNYRHLFPVLPERSRFNRRWRNLMGVINLIRQISLEDLKAGIQPKRKGGLSPVLLLGTVVGGAVYLFTMNEEQRKAFFQQVDQLAGQAVAFVNELQGKPYSQDYEKGDGEGI